MKRLFAAALIVAIAIFVSLPALSCTQTDPTFAEISGKYSDLAAKHSFSQKCGEGDGETVLFLGRTVTLNRLVLRETSAGITSFSLSLPGAPSPFYGNDFIGGYRYCTFPAVTTDRIILSFSSDGGWAFGKAEAYFVPRRTRSFSLTSYVTAKSAYTLSPGGAPSDVFDIIYSAYLDKDGNVFFPDYYLDGKRIEGEDVLRTCVSNLRNACPGAKIFATVLGDRERDGDGLTVQQRCSDAFSNADRLSSSLLALVNDYSLDGISFDYEYPSSKEDYSLFTGFCRAFRQLLPADKSLSAAVSSWCVDKKRLSADSLGCFDSLVLMAYDSPDGRGCHSTFYTAYSQIRKLKEEGIPSDRIKLGIPLYSKPLDGSKHSPVYAEYADSLPFFANTTKADCGGEYKPCYFNGRQLVSDKAVFALDAGLAGIAAWHYSLDSKDPALSLLSAARRAVSQ